MLHDSDVLSKSDELMEMGDFQHLDKLRKSTKFRESEGLDGLKKALDDENLSINKQQQHLLIARTEVEQFWMAVQMTVHGTWSKFTIHQSFPPFDTCARFTNSSYEV